MRNMDIMAGNKSAIRAAVAVRAALLPLPLLPLLPSSAVGGALLIGDGGSAF